MIDLRLGRWQDALADVEMVDAVITDPPYGERTHAGQRVDGTEDGSSRAALSYASWSPDTVREFCAAWSERCRGWICAMTSHDLIHVYMDALEASGRYVFAPIPCVITGMNVRLCGDGPSSWSVWMIVSRPRSMRAWGTLPGAYTGTPERGGHIGGKPLWLMQSIIRDYTRPGDLVCDPCAGGATTLLAAAIEGRRAIGAEMDPDTYAKAQKRIARGWTPTLPVCEALPMTQEGLKL